MRNTFSDARRPKENESYKPKSRTESGVGASVRLFSEINLKGNDYVAGAHPCLSKAGWNDRAMSCEVFGGPAILYEHKDYQGEYSMLRPGAYNTPQEMGMKGKTVSSFRSLLKSDLPGICLFEHSDYRGLYKGFYAHSDGSDLKRSGFNDRVTSIVVIRGTWGLFEHTKYGGKQWVLGPGAYHNSNAAGIQNDVISSVRYLYGG